MKTIVIDPVTRIEGHLRIEAEYASTVTGSAAQILSFAETIETAQG